MSYHLVSSTFTLPDGARLSYDIFGSEYLGKSKLPIILIGGMSNLKSDWERLSGPLSLSRPVLVFDHRGMGDSTYSTPARDDNVTIEMMAGDLLALVEHLGWRDIDMLGFSMGGVILQQLLLFSAGTTTFPFRVHHALLTGTLISSIQLDNLPAPSSASASLPPGQRLTVEQKKEIARPMLDASLGPRWVAQKENQERYQWWLERMIQGRPQRTILKQRKSLATFDFRQQLVKIPPSTKILVIHGKYDLLVPFSAGEQIFAFIPHARMVEIGTGRGTVPNYDFGHIWYEYFEADVWTGIIEAFVDDEQALFEKARL